MIIDHVFQPLVDWLGFDPERWAGRLFRIFALAIITTAASMATMVFLGMPGPKAFDGFVAMPVTAFGSIFMIDRMLRYPSYPPFQLIGPPFRLLMSVLAVWGLPVIVLSVIGEVNESSRDAAGNTPLLLRMMAFGMAVALPAGASALYVRICRRPPPKPPFRTTATI